MTSASNGLGLFDDGGEEISMLLHELNLVEVSSCEDFRFTFVSADKVDHEAVSSFATGKLYQFRGLVALLAEDLVPEGACLGSPEPSALRKRSIPSVVVGGRLVYRKLEEYAPEVTQPASSIGGAPFKPSAAAARLRVSALKSKQKMDDKLARGHVVDESGHLGVPVESLHDRASGQRAKAIEVGFLILHEVGKD